MLWGMIQHVIVYKYTAGGLTKMRLRGQALFSIKLVSKIYV